MKRKFSKAIICGIVTVLFFTEGIHGQVGIDLGKTYPSPDVASLGSYGLVSANTFNGQANVNVPLYTISYKELEIPLSLSYNTSGLKIDEHPGMTGLGWTLNSAGMIYRKVNGIYDEHPKEFPTTTYTDEQCYYYNCGRVASNYNNLDSIKKYAFDNVTAPEVIKNAYDAAPDEFIFNFGGYGGTFYFTRAYHGAPLEIKIKPNGAYHLKAEIVEIREYIDFDDYLYSGSFQTRRTKRSIYTIKITDDRGVQYLFGGNPSAIEFSNSGNLDLDIYTIASTWYLTQILSPNGYKIDLTYKKKGRVFTQHKQRNMLLYDEDYNFGSYGHALIFFNVLIGSGEVSSSGFSDKTSILIQNPSYLDSIKTPVQNVVFTTSPTSELNYTFSWDEGLYDPDGLPETETARRTSTWQKLDEINVAGVKKIKFNYRDTANKRLRLDSIEILVTHILNGNTFKFNYDTLSLPAYNSRKADHWGYYNGRTYAYDTNYLTTREPVATYLQAEMLKQITYPTGGTTTLEYEPHAYKKIAKQLPFSVDNADSNTIAGGLRIKKITSIPDSGTAPLVKEYFYIKDYITDGTASSGVLSGQPQYANSGSKRTSFRTGNFWSGSWGSSVLTYGKVVDNNFLQLGTTNGNHITYTQVTEKSDNGYMVQEFANHDNGYIDKEPYIMHTNFNSKFQEEAFISLENFRGSALSTEVYDSLKRKIKKTQFEYFTDTSSAYKVPYFFRMYDSELALSRVSTGAYFTKPVLLRNTKDTTYVVPSGNTISTIADYKYFPDLVSGTPEQDNYKERQIDAVNSTGQTIRTTYKYPEEFSATSPYDEMITRNMISPVVERLDSNLTQNKQLSRQKTNYQFWHADTLILPATVQASIGGNTLETETTMQQYDTKANILQTTDKAGIATNYIWDYNLRYPIAQVLGADTASVAATSFEADGKGGWTYSGSVTGTYFLTGTKSYLPSGGNVTKTGLASATYIVSYWGKSGSVNVNSAGPTRTGKSMGDWTYYEHEVTTTSVTISGSNYIDELRLYPKGAMMKTFTYKPLIGMTSECDASSRINFYEYDFFNRLKIIRNDDGKILKRIDYKYKANYQE